MWRILSADPCVKVYLPEPLHPQLPTEIEQQKHYHVYRDYPGALQAWSPSFHRDKIRLAPADQYPELEQYLSHFVHDGALIKFVRMTLRTGWLLDMFPDAFLINVVRDPRAVCYSYLKYLRRIAPQGLIQKIRNKLAAKGRATAPSFDSTPYWAAEYFDLFRHVPRWRDYMDSLSHEPAYTKVLALWRVNVEQSLDDLNCFGGDRSTTILYEQLVTEPTKTLTAIYEMMGSYVPLEVLREGRGETVHDIGGKKKWQRNISKRWLDEWRQVDSSVWREGLAQAELEPLMERLGYRMM